MISIRYFCRIFSIIVVFISMQNQLFSQAAMPKPDPNRFAREIEYFIRWDHKNAYPEDGLLFVGSSSIRMWKTHDFFPDMPVINRGFGGAHLSDVYYFADSIVIKYQPKGIILYAGDNDIAGEKSPEKVFDDFKSFVSRVESAVQGVTFIYLPIKPSISRWRYRDRMRKANDLIRQFIEARTNCLYADTATTLLGSDGKPNPAFFIEDGLHLSHEGYAAWSNKLRPYLEKLMNK